MFSGVFVRLSPRGRAVGTSCPGPVKADPVHGRGGGGWMWLGYPSQVTLPPRWLGGLVWGGVGWEP